jgi:hypothetical protein
MMAEQKHTPGPWRFGVDGDEKPFDYKGPGYYQNPSIFGPDWQEVVGCEEYYVFSGPADARLIAAAPDLLEALKQVERVVAVCLDWRDAVKRAGIACPIDQMYAAIAKAEGK